MPYGPADIITDRVDGLLVKSGDVSGLRDAIAWLGERSDRELRVMRRAARLTAERYGGEAVTRRWLVELTAASNRGGARPSLAEAWSRERARECGAPYGHSSRGFAPRTEARAGARGGLTPHRHGRHIAR